MLNTISAKHPYLPICSAITAAFVVINADRAVLVTNGVDDIGYHYNNHNDKPVIIKPTHTKIISQTFVFFKQ